MFWVKWDYQVLWAFLSAFCCVLWAFLSSIYNSIIITSPIGFNIALTKIDARLKQRCINVVPMLCNVVSMSFQRWVLTLYQKCWLGGWFISLLLNLLNLRNLLCEWKLRNLLTPWLTFGSQFRRIFQYPVKHPTWVFFA